MVRASATAPRQQSGSEEPEDTRSTTSSSSAASTVVPTTSTSASASAPKPRQPDPSQPGRTVPHKKANAAFLVHKQWKEDRRQAAIAAGRDPDQEDQPMSFTPLRVLLKWALLAGLAAMAIGQFVTGDVLYGYEGRWRDPKRWIPPRPRTFTPSELSLYNGRDPSRPVYLSILGNVYDVTRGGKTYRPGGSYWFFSGKDASRAYVTGCFKTHLTHDLRGLGEGDLESIRQWDNFFATNPKYHKVGTLQLPKIDPESPIPEPCD